MIFILTSGIPSVNRIDLQALTLGGPTVTRLVIDSLALLLPRQPTIYLHWFKFWILSCWVSLEKRESALKVRLSENFFTYATHIPKSFCLDIKKVWKTENKIGHRPFLWNVEGE